MSAVRVDPTFGSADKEQDRNDVLAKFELLNSAQRDSVLRTIPEPLTEPGAQASHDALQIEAFIRSMEQAHVTPFDELQLWKKKPTYIQTVVLTLALFLKEYRDTDFVAWASYQSGHERSLRVNYRSFDEASVNQYFMWLLGQYAQGVSYDLRSEPHRDQVVNVRNAFTRLICTTFKI